MIGRSALVILSGFALAHAGELVLPDSALERDRPVTAVYRTNPQATGKGTLAIKWTDILGRVVEDRTVPVTLTDETEIRFPLDLRRAVAMVNEVKVHFSFEGVNKKGAPDHREEDATVSFVAKPPDRKWSDYAIIMWQRHTAEQFATLKTLGINGGQYGGKATTLPDLLLKNNLRWYAENIATDFYSEYHRYRPDRIQNWSYLQAKELYKKDPSSKEAFKRHPSLSDPVWLEKIHDRLVESARTFSPYRPFFYDLGDESGIADLAAFWDFDFSDQSLVPMRRWLQARYGTLGALNEQWGSAFAAWDLVTPQTTSEAMKRTDDNYSSWADHKEWMDISYASAIKMGVDAVRSVDPDAYVAIAGGQMPGWGGYDYYRLSQVLTAIEPYDIGNNVEILRSLNPSIAFVTTAFARGPWERHRIWYELLHGARGNLIWDDKSGFIAKDGSIGDRGREVAPYYNELRNGIGALLINSSRQSDPIAIHYSQSSMRTEWMLAQKPKGDAWVERTSSTKRKDSDFLRVRESYCRLVEDLGLQYNFVAYGQLEDGELLKRGYRLLILPRSSSLSPAEAKAIREFAEQGGSIISDGDAGTFDEHSRWLSQSSLAGVEMAHLNALTYHQDRLVGKEGPLREAAQKLIAAAGVRPEFSVADEFSGSTTGIETHTFRNGGVTLLAVLSNPELRVDELGPPEFRSNARFEKPRALRVSLPHAMYVYDVRSGKALGNTDSITLTLDPYEPAIYALTPTRFPPLRVSAPARVKHGESAGLSISFDGVSSAATHVLHLEVTDPAGKTVGVYSGNVLAQNGTAAKAVPVAVNDPAGKWTVLITDLLSGQRQTVSLEVI